MHPLTRFASNCKTELTDDSTVCSRWRDANVLSSSLIQHSLVVSGKKNLSLLSVAAEATVPLRGEGAMLRHRAGAINVMGVIFMTRFFWVWPGRDRQEDWMRQLVELANNTLPNTRLLFLWGARLRGGRGFGVEFVWHLVCLYFVLFSVTLKRLCRLGFSSLYDGASPDDCRHSCEKKEGFITRRGHSGIRMSQHKPQNAATSHSLTRPLEAQPIYSLNQNGIR